MFYEIDKQLPVSNSGTIVFDIIIRNRTSFFFLCIVEQSFTTTFAQRQRFIDTLRTRVCSRHTWFALSRDNFRYEFKTNSFPPPPPPP